MRGRSWSLLFGGPVAGLACTGVPGAGAAAQSGTLLFAAQLGNRQLYTLRIGEIPQRVTAEPSANSFGGALSPDGTQIGFDRGGDIYVMRRDGSAVRRLTDGVGSNFDPAWSPDGKRLAFTTTRFGKAEATVMNADGTRVVRITHNHVNDLSPSWSPDGRRLVVVRNVGKRHSDLWIVRLAGRGEKRLTRGQDAWDAEWSPDGRRIAFARIVGRLADFDGDLMVVDRDGRHLRRLTRGKAQDFSPSWSPDSRWLVFDRYGAPGSGLNVIGADGKGRHSIEPRQGRGGFNPSWGGDGTIAFEADLVDNTELQLAEVGDTSVRTLTDNDVVDYDTRWSPDGSRIAFIRHTSSFGGDVFVMTADGSDATNLTRNDDHDVQPAWSPDGKQLVFVSYRNDDDSDGDLFLMNVDGTSQQRLTVSDATDVHPDWSPDGTKIAFARDPRGGGNDGDVWVVNADGTDAHPLTSDPADEGEPMWSPDSRKVLFVRETSGRTEIRIMNADGSQRPLIVDSVDVAEPAWSANGSEIAYDRFTAAGASVYIANAAGLDRRLVAVACGVDALAEVESDASCHEPGLLEELDTRPAPSWRPPGSPHFGSKCRSNC
jgi:TolB protein